MTRARQPLAAASLVVLAALRLEAQGVTGAAVYGTVVSEAGVAIVDAIVHVTNESNGERWQTVTRSKGRYFLENVSIGGPYRLAVRALGYSAAERRGIFLSLGQRFTADFTLSRTALDLPAVQVRAPADPRIHPARTGPSQIVGELTIGRIAIPGAERDVSLLALLSPQVTLSPNGGLSFAGQHDRLNALQIDGASNQSMWGLSTGGIGSPGGMPAVSPEAVAELRVLAAPFDVRFGSFAGGLVNAVSKSGSNEFRGSVFGYYEDHTLTGQDALRRRAPVSSRREIGLVVGGPVVRDRVAFFASLGSTYQEVPQRIPEIGADTVGGRDSMGVGIRFASAVRFQDILRNQYGVDAGTFSRAITSTPTENLFVKFTAQLGVNSRLDVSHTYAHSGARFGPEFRSPGFYPLSSWFASQPPTSNATRLNWTTMLGRRFTNDLLIVRRSAGSKCHPTANFPMVVASADEGDLVAGHLEQCLGQFERENLVQVVDNLGVAAGAHVFTFGTQNQFVRLRDFVMNFPGGLWIFPGLDELEQGRAAVYVRDLPGPLRPEGPLADFRVDQVGFYAQDRWTPTARVTMTMGLRLDLPYLPRAPALNPTLVSQLGIRTSATPSGNPLWSPRLAASFDPRGRGSTFIRGGVGLFTGPPALFWFEQAYTNTGLEQARLTCIGVVPAVTLDPDNQPTSCSATRQPPVPTIVFFDPSFRFPHNLKVALGADHRLPRDIVATLDVLYSRGIHQFEERDVNLRPPASVSIGEAGRPLYGTIDPTSAVAIPGRVSGDFGHVIEITNGHGDRSYSVTGQLQKRARGGRELATAYTYTHATDRMVAVADLAFSNLARTPIDGTLEHRNATTSYWSRPHKLTFLAAMDLPLALQLSVFYNGHSGRAFTYVIDGDANADGIGDQFDETRKNDIVYVPRGADDISLDTPADFEKLDRYIEAEPCLRGQRGRMLERNSCREAWVHITNARLAKVLPLGAGQSLHIGIDVFNLLNLLNRRWGVVRGTTAFDQFGNVPLLQLVGYDVDRQRGIYRVLTPQRNRVFPELSRWRLRLNTRYVF